MDFVPHSLSDLSRRRFLGVAGAAAAGLTLPWSASAADGLVDGGTFVPDAAMSALSVDGGANLDISLIITNVVMANVFIDNVVVRRQKFNFSITKNCRGSHHSRCMVATRTRFMGA